MKEGTTRKAVLDTVLASLRRLGEMTVPGAALLKTKQDLVKGEEAAAAAAAAPPASVDDAPPPAKRRKTQSKAKAASA